MSLQVLPSTWSKTQVKDYMKKDVAAALGVKCDHCHDPGNYAAETPKKRIGLAMMKMVEMLNKQSFKGKPRITCVLCHQGKLEPK